MDTQFGADCTSQTMEPQLTGRTRLESHTVNIQFHSKTKLMQTYHDTLQEQGIFVTNDINLSNSRPRNNTNNVVNYLALAEFKDD